MDETIYTQNIQKVKQIIANLESENTSIESMNEKIKEALSLLKECKESLATISQQSDKIIEEIKEENEKNITFAPLNKRN